MSRRIVDERKVKLNTNMDQRGEKLPSNILIRKYLSSDCDMEMDLNDSDSSQSQDIKEYQILDVHQDGINITKEEKIEVMQIGDVNYLNKQKSHLRHKDKDHRTS